MSLLAEVNWNSIFRPEIMVFVCVFSFLTIVGVFRAITSAWKAVEKNRNESQLKAQMIERGYRADEIERVICATAMDTDDAACSPSKQTEQHAQGHPAQGTA